MIVSEVFAGAYTLKFNSLPAYDEGSVDNHVYDAVYGKDSEYRFTAVYEISVFLTNDLLKRVLIRAKGGGTAIHKTSLVIEEDLIVICCSDTVFCLSLPELTLLWNTKADLATCFEVFKYQSDYIVHGELEISRLSRNGEIIWQQSGADIFVSTKSNEDNFAITDNYILATDWDNRKYKFDFDGNIIV
ncbi:hypothetical protein SNE25_03795 [Mucilaginibacter sabulilitoris]|uniref:Uncharacterized protein n=1 Tax=Mucilaginibacter sabulilitoris TaxID=1173583 RepID=A0ABZ0TR48_9SPHI|nr:hypothetical protein [Mucilaginibacter sabulilitoris]WPU94643.1 hypothetical protein SNE25_03795 [Mucilaginibacter sabulilitoris]